MRNPGSVNKVESNGGGHKVNLWPPHAHTHICNHAFTHRHPHTQTQKCTGMHATPISYAKKKKKSILLTPWEVWRHLASLRCVKEFRNPPFTCHRPASFPSWVYDQLMGDDLWFHRADRRTLGPAWGCCPACHCTPVSSDVTQALTECSRGTLRSFQNWSWGLLHLFYYEYLPIKVAQWRQRRRFYSFYFF